MNLITKITVKNFKCFRSETVFDFAQSTYLIGINNAGKTAVLQSIKYFFGNDYPDDGSFLNRTEFVAKKAGYNRTEIKVTFNLELLETVKRKNDLIKKYGKNLSLVKQIVFTPESRIINVSWKINVKEKIVVESNLDEDLLWLLKSIKVTYIHPQEGRTLLENVQKRLRQRLLANWGRGAALTHNLKELENRWGEMRLAANKYLSQSLTDSVQSFWPGSKVMIDLPKKVREIIDVADISFQGDRSLPEIELTSQGTGAQSTILYLAHYLLDSDRSLNRGEYHPIWLMEEPESFLHADLLVKLAKQLSSDMWLSNIQMVISSHSPILLASSRAASSNTRWLVLNNFQVMNSLCVDEVSGDVINSIGELMGDTNFPIYFSVVQKNDIFYIEDSRKITTDVFQKSGLSITRGLEGVPAISKMLDVLRVSPEIIVSNVFFLVDGDKGLKDLTRHLSNCEIDKEECGFKRYKMKDVTSVFIVTLPDECIVENLFEEYENHVMNCIEKIWEPDFTLKENTPSDLSRAVGEIRKRKIDTLEDQTDILKNNQDVKDLFWRDVKEKQYNLSKKCTSILSKLIKT